MSTRSVTATRELNKKILSIAIPTFGQLFAESALVLVDTAIVGHISTQALSGLSIGSGLILTAVGLCVFLAYGTTSQVGTLMGAGKRKQALETGINGIWLALSIGIAISIILFLFAEPMSYVLGARGEILDNSVTYIHTMVFGVPGALLVYAANGIFRAANKASLPLIAACVGTAVNILLDLAFVFGLHLGIAGSGYATFIAQWVMGLIVAIPAFTWARKLKANIMPQVKSIVSTAQNGFMLFLRTLAMRTALVTNIILATNMGAQVLASYQVVNAHFNFVMNMLDAIAIAGQALVANELGAQHKQQAQNLLHYCAKVGFYSGILIGVLLIILGFTTPHFYSNDSAVITLITAGMCVLGLFLPLSGWMWALDGILIGAGDYTYLAKTCLIVVLAYIPSAYIMYELCTIYSSTQIIRTILLWLLICISFIGGRAICNGLRARGTAWMNSYQ
ncbi:MAG: MATE family efflux transporter [Bifidobacteriaceae bacterium]|nr:MATE family efflux transporter [Bifidobacteriaceae bacterium]